MLRRAVVNALRPLGPFAGGRRAAAMSAVAAAAALGALAVQSSAACDAPNVMQSLAEINTKLDAINKALGIAAVSFKDELKAIAAVKLANPKNLAMKYFSESYFASLTDADKVKLIKIVRSGFENADSGMGCYANTPSDYDVFALFFAGVINEYHGGNADSVHRSSWDISSVGDKGVLDVTKLGLKELSMRVRVGRNLADFNLPGSMDRAERVKFEQTMLKAFAKLQSMKEYGGAVYSLTPDFNGEKNPNLISDAKYKELIKAHIMFKDMDEDSYLKSAGISADWPYGRGCWVSDDKQCIIWFGEEDQLRIMCMKTGTKLNEVFERLKKMLDTVEAIEGVKFARSEKYGYVTSCPTNLGTGMRASVHVKVPALTAGGSDAKAVAVARPLGLSVRGMGGEHTPIGQDGTIDISPKARLFIQEKDIIAALYKGIELLMAEEKKVATAGDKKAVH